MDYNQIKNLLFSNTLTENAANNFLIVTQDKVFLPNDFSFSLSENADYAMSNIYFLDECPATDYALANNVFCFQDNTINSWSSD